MNGNTLNSFEAILETRRTLERQKGGLQRCEAFLTRHPDNPILQPKDFGDVDAVFNCGQTIFEGKTLLLVPVCPKQDVPRMHVATSRDGVNFDVRPEPFITATTDHPWSKYDEWPIDPRVTKIEDAYYITRPIQAPMGASAILERTTDFVNREVLGCIALAPNRVPCLFPDKINGKYYRLDRPSAPGGPREPGEIWLSSSPDLLHWGGFRPLLGTPVSHVWATEKIGPTPPIRTKDGWLVIYHAVIRSSAGTRYSLGSMLLDLEKPWEIRGISSGWLITPDADYEFQGNVPNTIFACGAIADESANLLRIYYGAADTSIGLAVGRLDDIISETLTGNPVRGNYY
jgi:beta-1,4-mannooligosaccharide/beta-1,4-mannosyl-N-acetylglucosamine phosphorylase